MLPGCYSLFIYLFIYSKLCSNYVLPSLVTKCTQCIKISSDIFEGRANHYNNSSFTIVSLCTGSQQLQATALFLRALVGRNISRGTKSDDGYQAIPVLRFDSRRLILLTREKQERKSLLTLQI